MTFNGTGSHLWRCEELSGTVNGPNLDPDSRPRNCKYTILAFHSPADDKGLLGYERSFPRNLKDLAGAKGNPKDCIGNVAHRYLTWIAPVDKSVCRMHLALLSVVQETKRMATPEPPRATFGPEARSLIRNPMIVLEVGTVDGIPQAARPCRR